MRLPVTPLETHGPVVQRPRRLAYTQETMVQLRPGLLRLGRQLADHLGLEPGMLWVQIPPEPLRMVTNDQWPRGAAWSARLPVTLEITGSNPVEVAFGRHGAVRKPAKRPSSNLGDCGFNSRLRHSKICVGWASVSLTDCKSAATGCAGSTPTRRTENMARSSIGIGYQTLNLVSRVQFPHGLLNKTKWRNW